MHFTGRWIWLLAPVAAGCHPGAPGPVPPARAAPASPPEHTSSPEAPSPACPPHVDRYRVHIATDDADPSDATDPSRPPQVTLTPVHAGAPPASGRLAWRGQLNSDPYEDLLVANPDACGNWGECPIGALVGCGDDSFAAIVPLDQYFLQLDVTDDADAGGWRILRELGRTAQAGEDFPFEIQWRFDPASFSYRPGQETLRMLPLISDAKRDRIVAAMPGYFRPMFEVGRASFYTLRDDVDPHSPDGGRIVTDQRVQCTVESVVLRAKALLSELRCVDEDGDPPIGFAPYLLRSIEGEGLWMPETDLPSHGAALEIMQAPPMFSDPPTTRKRTFNTEGMSPDQPNRCTVETTISPKRVCHRQRCIVPVGYGDSLLETCFTDGEGLTHVRAENSAHPPRWLRRPSRSIRSAAGGREVAA